MNINEYKNYYFIGIGGIGMSALARYFKMSGKNVMGYDKTETELTLKLVSEDISISYFDDVSKIPSMFSQENSLIVYTPAVPKDLQILNFFSNNGFEVQKRSKVLGLLTQNTFSICIAGTHGKTTTSTLLGHLFKYANMPSTAFIGGISENYQSNFIFNGTEISIIEADEFDRSFLTLSPDIACITSTDADHLDIYGEKENLVKSFQDFAALIDKNGLLFVKKGLDIHTQHFTYSVEEIADYHAENIKITVEYISFDLHTPTEIITDFQLPLPGRHNVENATVALAIALNKGIDKDILKQALKEFKGIKRRFSRTTFENGKVLIDDYAHHPTELKAVLRAVRNLYPGKKLLTVFQPHLFTRTRDFAEDFAKSLENTDSLILLDIYPARELQIEGITSEWLCEKIQLQNKKVCTLQNTVEEVQKQEFDILLIVGAGNIDTIVEPLKKQCEEKTN